MALYQIPVTLTRTYNVTVSSDDPAADVATPAKRWLAAATAAQLADRQVGDDVLAIGLLVTQVPDEVPPVDVTVPPQQADIEPTA